MLSKIVNALGVIIGDAIEGWAMKMPREELVGIINVQTERIRELEDELDIISEEVIELKQQVAELEMMEYTPKCRKCEEPKEKKICGYPEKPCVTCKAWDFKNPDADSPPRHTVQACVYCLEPLIELKCLNPKCVTVTPIDPNKIWSAPPQRFIDDDTDGEPFDPRRPRDTCSRCGFSPLVCICPH